MAFSTRFHAVNLYISTWIHTREPVCHNPFFSANRDDCWFFFQLPVFIVPAFPRAFQACASYFWVGSCFSLLSDSRRLFCARICARSPVFQGYFTAGEWAPDWRRSSPPFTLNLSTATHTLCGGSSRRPKGTGPPLFLGKKRREMEEKPTGRARLYLIAYSVPTVSHYHIR